MVKIDLSLYLRMPSPLSNHGAFGGGSLPINTSHSNFVAAHASMQSSAHAGSSPAAWGHNFNAAPLAGMASSSMLPASFGVGLTSLSMPSQTVPIGSATHMMGSFARSSQSGLQHNYGQHSVNALNASSLRHASSTQIAGVSLSLPVALVR